MPADFEFMPQLKAIEKSLNNYIEGKTTTPKMLQTELSGLGRIADNDEVPYELSGVGDGHTKEFLLFCLNATQDNDLWTIDGICERFDVDLFDAINSSDVLEVARLNDDVINFIEISLFRYIIEKAIDKYDLDYNDFDFYIDYSDTHLWYKGNLINSFDDLEELIN